MQTLLEKLGELAPERVAEVEDFIDFLKSRDQDRQLTQVAMQTAERSFTGVWDNPDDAVYDRL
ncbi:MAG: toxin-antitoxin system, antitoxin component, Xre family protein [Gammaproteobacteria bacterium]|nr:toxin-antitoxin system, antitoxin component, Xre family protein [Gammaproteobacteria bacterium]